MRTSYNPNQSPRVIIIQKLYGNFFNEETDLTEIQLKKLLNPSKLTKGGISK